MDANYTFMLCNFQNPKFRKQSSFTLVELLVTIAILALLMSIIIISINPAEILKKTRDVRRMSDINSLNRAIQYFQASLPNTSLGSNSTVYVSIPDTSSTCSNLDLPALPGWSYHCSDSTNYRKTDGNGWIPLNFTSLDIGSPLSSLPIDPKNTTSTGLYYTYVAGGSWEINARLESRKNKYGGDQDSVSEDGGDDLYLYEFGSNLNIFKFEKLTNADFSTGDLTGWINYAGGGINGTTTTATHWASFSAIIKNSNSYCNNYYVQDLPVQQNSVYTIGVWIKTVDEVGNAGVGIANTSWGDWHSSTPMTGTRDWTYVSVNANSGSNTTLRFFLTVQWCGGPSPGNGPSGTTYFAEPSVMAGSVLFNN